MCSFAPDFSFGAQAIVDAAQNAAGAGWPVYYRVANFASQTSTEFEELGFQTQAATATGQTGYTDLKIMPQPRVKNLSMRDITNSGGSLNMSSRLFVISDTFVQNVMKKYPTITDPEQVWDGFDQFIGLVYNDTLYGVVQYANNVVSGKSVEWRLICNAVKNPPSK